MRLSRKDAEDRALVKRLKPGQELSIRQLAGFHRAVRRMIDRKLSRHGWGLQTGADGQEEGTARIVESGDHEKNA